MRSELVFGAVTYVPNRFLLTRVAAKAIRRFHRANTRIQDTANEVFQRFARANPLAGVPCTRQSAVASPHRAGRNLSIL